MSEFESRRENIDQKPFVIRGHHIKDYIILIRRFPYMKRPTPAEEASHMRSVMVAFPLIPPDGSSWNHSISSRLEYSQDVIGTSAESTDRYEKRLRKTFEKFISLPDDYPAELTQTPDTICEACAVGEHCRSYAFVSRILGADTNSAGDSEGLDQFLTNLNLLNLPKPTVSYEQAHLPDADPEQVRRITTTLGVVRRVLEETKIEMWSK